MKCDICHNPMKPLFTSYFCPWCDERKAERERLLDAKMATPGAFPVPYTPGAPPTLACDGTYVNGLGNKQKCSIWLGCGLPRCPHQLP